MDQDDLVDNIVIKYREDPRNKVIIDCGDLLHFASEELGISINAGAPTVTLVSRWLGVGFLES